MNNIKEKACKKCQKVKPVNDFYENKYSPDGRYAFCKVCFDQFAQKLKDKKPDLPAQKIKKTKSPDLPAPKTKKPPPPDLSEKKRKAKKPVPESVQKTTIEPISEPALKPPDKPAQKQSQKSEQAPEPEQIQKPADDFDFIEYLLENQGVEKKAALEKLQIPKQITKIKARKRVCNGCGKTEEIDQVEKNTVIPVHAWFCDYCTQRETKRRVKKGTTIQDYWGREFKVKKIISNDLVMGVVKNKDGNWGKKILKIYGNWKTP